MKKAAKQPKVTMLTVAKDILIALHRITHSIDSVAANISEVRASVGACHDQLEYSVHAQRRLAEMCLGIQRQLEHIANSASVATGQSEIPEPLKWRKVKGKKK